ncbi:MAG: type II CAAX endopeptidase family protein [Ruthenibacterium sp.]
MTSMYRKTCSQLGTCYFMLLFATQVFSFLFVQVIHVFAPQAMQADWFIWASSYVPLYAVGVPIFMLLLRSMPNYAAPEKHSLPPKKLLTYLILCLGAVYICNIVSIGINSFLSFLKGSVISNPLADVVSNSGFVYNLLIGCIVAPVGEEFFFRKWLYGKIGQYGTRTYVLLGGFLFALMHGNLSQLLYAFVVGMIFCYLYAQTGKLCYTIGLHIIVNLCGICMPLLLQSTIGAAAASGIIIALMLSASIIFALNSHAVTYTAGMEPLPPHPVLATLCNVGMGSYLLLCSLLIFVGAFAV